MRRWLQALLVATFLTASFRLIPFPLGDTARTGVFGLLALLTVRGGATKFGRDVWPLLAVMTASLLVDVIFERIGILTSIVWVQFLAGVLVASVVYTMRIGTLKLTIWLSIGLLVANFIVIIFFKSFFIAMASSIGVVDPFVTHGRSLDRVYYAYFNANTAAYSIYFILLSFLASDRIQPFSWGIRWFGLVVMACLIFLTGGRGVFLLLVSLAAALTFVGRSSRALMIALFLTVGWIVVFPLYSQLAKLILLREQSNTERLTALWEYVELIGEKPIIGHGIQTIMFRVEQYGFKASHNFFVEVVAMFGFALGVALIVYLFVKLVARPSGAFFKVLGLFALLPGLLTNTLLTTWAFIPLAVPVIIRCARNHPSVAGGGQESVKAKSLAVGLTGSR